MKKMLAFLYLKMTLNCYIFIEINTKSTFTVHDFLYTLNHRLAAIVS